MSAKSRRDPAFLRHYAAVLVTQYRVFRARGDREFALTLLRWARKALREARALPVQREMFS